MMGRGHTPGKGAGLLRVTGLPTLAAMQSGGGLVRTLARIALSGFIALATAMSIAPAGLVAQDAVLRRDALDPAFRRALDGRRLRELSAGAGTREPSVAGNDALRIAKGAMLVARDEPTPPQRFTADALLPIHFGVVASPGAAADPQLVSFRPKASSSGVFAKHAEGYRAQLVVSLVPDDASAEVVLPRSVTLAVLVEGGTANPPVIAFAQLDETKVIELAIPTARDKVLVSIEVHQSDVEAVKLEFGTQRGRVQLAASPIEILGYGLGTATILVEGDELVGAGTAIGLQTDAGHLDPLRPVLDAQRGATATLRSDGVGQANVRAPSWDTEAVAVRFVAPLAFLLFALLGGVLGTALRIFRKAARSWPRALLVGTGAGVLGAVLWALGLRVLTLDFAPATTEFAALGISALVGLGLGTFWQPKAR